MLLCFLFVFKMHMSTLICDVIYKVIIRFNGLI